MVLEATLSEEKDLKSTLQPFRFLFQSPLNGTLQVDFAIVNPPPADARLLPRSLRRSPVPKASWKDVNVKINIQKKRPVENTPTLATTNKNNTQGILCVDQSLPGCCFYLL